MGFPRQEYWNGLPFPPPGDLPNPGIEHWLLCVSCTGRFFTTSATWDVEDVGSIPGLGRFPGGGDGNPFQYSCLGNPMDSGAWDDSPDQIRSDQVAQSCPTLCDPMNRSTPGLPVHHQLPEFTETHVH